MMLLKFMGEKVNYKVLIHPRNLKSVIFKLNETSVQFPESITAKANRAKEGIFMKVHQDISAITHLGFQSRKAMSDELI